MSVRRLALLAVVAALALAGSGCGVAGDGADRRIRLPAALPGDVPLPERAVLRSARDLGARAALRAPEVLHERMGHRGDSMPGTGLAETGFRNGNGERQPGGVQRELSFRR